MHFSSLKSILLRGLGLSSISPRNPKKVFDKSDGILHLIQARQQIQARQESDDYDFTSGAQIIYSIPANGDSYAGVPQFNWTQVTATFTANSSGVIFSILVRNDPSFFSFDDFSCTDINNGTVNLIANPGFESGSTDPWFRVTVPGLPYAGYVASDEQDPSHSGNYDFYNGAVGGIDSISQILMTTPGASYSVSFWIAEEQVVPVGIAGLAQAVVSDFGPPTNLHLLPDTDSGNNRSDGITNDGKPTIVGDASPRIGVNVYLNGTFVGEVNSDQNGTFQIPLTSGIPPGQTTVTASSVVGNLTSVRSAPFVVTYMPPSAPTLTWQGTYGNGSVIRLAGVGSPKTNVTILDTGTPLGTAMTSPNGSYTFLLPNQTDGLHNYTAQEPTDAAGNVRLSPPLGVVVIPPPPNPCDSS